MDGWIRFVDSTEVQIVWGYLKYKPLFQGGEDVFAFFSTTSSTASSCDTEFTKEDEQRLKDYIQQLKNDRAAVKLTMLELESIHIDPLSYDVKPRGDSQRLDLENAVLMQELMAMKVFYAKQSVPWITLSWTKTRTQGNNHTCTDE